MATYPKVTPPKAKTPKAAKKASGKTGTTPKNTKVAKTVRVW